MISINLTIHNKAFLIKRVLDGIKNNTINMEIYKQVQTQPNEKFIKLF